MSSNKTVPLEKLTEEELAEFKTKRYNMFKLTISVCVIYGVVALVLLLIGIFTKWGQQVLFNDVLAFMITFIIGTIIIVIYLANEIYNFKPAMQESSLGYDSDICPDYWKLEYIENKEQPDEEGKSYLDPALNKYQFQYKCTIDDRITNNDKLSTMKNGANNFYTKTNDNKLYVKLGTNEESNRKAAKLDTESDFNEFKKYAAYMSGYSYTYNTVTNTHNINKNNNNSIMDDKTTPTPTAYAFDTVPLPCDTVYPLFLSIADAENQKKNPSDPPNKFRCAYAKSCGVPWTDAGCGASLDE